MSPLNSNVTFKVVDGKKGGRKKHENNKGEKE
jgi:hypothetical protein